MLQRRSSSKTHFSVKKPKQAQNSAKINRPLSRGSDTHTVITKIVNELQKNIQQLRRVCQAQKKVETKAQLFRGNKCKSKSQRKQSSREKEVQDDPSIEELRRSFLNTNGYETDNIIELFNFYKKGFERSTGLFASQSRTIQPNSVQNYSDVYESKGQACSAVNYEPNETYQSQFSKENDEPNSSVSRHRYSKHTEYIESISRRKADLVNVTNLLAERKKISRDTICQKMNTGNLLHQAKKRLVRPSTRDNIERNSRAPDQLRREPANHLSSKKTSRKQTSHSNKAEKLSPIVSHAQSPNPPSGNSKLGKSSRRTPSKLPPVVSPFQRGNTESPDPNRFINCQRQPKLKSAFSVASERSPNLNQGLIFQNIESGKSNNEKFYRPRLRSPSVNSLEDCGITLKESSRAINLSDIPFQF